MKATKSQNPMRMILIDDDPLYRAIVLRHAQIEGIDLDVFESLLDLGTVGMLGQYRAAIVDYDLGNLNGVEIAEYLSALFGNIPMVLVSEQSRLPGTKGWPTSIKTFVKKSDGYVAALDAAKALVAEGRDGETKFKTVIQEELAVG